MKHLKTIVLLTFLFPISFNLFAQEKEESSLSFYGFIRNDLFFDTYKGVESIMDQFYLMPNYKGIDANGEHLNEQGSAHLSAVSSRLGLKVAGPEILGANTIANIEMDFSGVTTVDPVLVRIRKAYYKLTWENSNLLVGQNWHPMWGGSCYPTTGSLNTGAPFQPFNRSPQINYTATLNKIDLSAAAIYENQYVSRGFYAPTNSKEKTLPKRNAGIPEVVLSAVFNSGNFTVGAAAQHNTILPIDHTTGNNGSTYVSDQMHNSSAALAYIQFKNENLKVLAKSVYGQNLANLTMLGGYGVKSIDANTGAYEYTNYTHSASFLNVVYGKTYQLGFFAGFTKNLGTTDALAGTSDEVKTAGLMTNIQTLYRLAPHISYNVKKFKVAVEYEMTSAEYGTGAINTDNGLYNSTIDATNHRLLLTTTYLF